MLWPWNHKRVSYASKPPSDAQLVRAIHAAVVEQVKFEATHPEPYDQWQRETAIAQRATQMLRDEGRPAPRDMTPRIRRVLVWTGPCKHPDRYSREGVLKPEN